MTLTDGQRLAINTIILVAFMLAMGVIDHCSH
jgi:hypothetical protein